MPDGETPEIPERQSPVRELFMYERPAGRIELFIRIVYWILIGIVTWVYSLVAGICMFIQWFVILVLGRRSEGLSTFIRGYLEYYIHVMPYVTFMTDRRPGILPVPVRIYEEEMAGEQGRAG